MKKFRIEYLDPETEEIITIFEEFEDSLPTEDSPLLITAKEWAEDLAYSCSDKRWYEVTEVRNQG